jgi:hypothetical protein
MNNSSVVLEKDDTILLITTLTSAAFGLIGILINCFQSYKMNHFRMSSPCCSMDMGNTNKKDISDESSINRVGEGSTTELKVM